MNYRMILHTLGRIMLVEAGFLLIPLGISIYHQDSALWSFVITILLLLTIGLPLTLKKPKNHVFYAREGFLIAALTWIMMSLFGALPFFLSGAIPNFVESLFETVSGFTTTGATLLTNIEALPKSLLFWRSETHWIGGMGVLVLMMAIVPKSDGQSMHIMRAEVPGPVVGKLVSKTTVTARILYAIYLGLTILEVVLLCAGGMPLFDSIVNSMGTTGTGGFAVLNAGIAGYNSLYCEIVIMVFMFLSGINFSLFYLLFIGQIKQAVKSEELRCYSLIALGAIVAIALNIMSIYGSFTEALRYSGFQVVSIMTSTGFSTADYTLWPVFSQLLVVLLMFFGACAGSTGGGMKIVRLVILGKSATREIKRVFNPRSVAAIKLDGKPVEEEVVKSVSLFFFLHVFLAIVSCVLISFDPFGYDISESVSGVITCINNIGPGLGRLGPAGNFSGFSDFSTIVLTLDMLVGRLEIYPILMLFLPSTWKRI